MKTKDKQMQQNREDRERDLRHVKSSKPIEQVLNLDDDGLVRRPRVGHVAAQAIRVRRNRRAVTNPGLHGCCALFGFGMLLAPIPCLSHMRKF